MSAVDNPSAILVGMPGSGKSTTGVMLAKALGLDFIDTDILIQLREEKTLHDILRDRDYLHLRQLEEEVLLNHKFNNMVVATGGSAIYSEKGIEHLKQFGTIIYLKADISELRERVGNLVQRGVAAPKGMTFEDIAAEREPLYEKHADMVVHTQGLNANEVLQLTLECLENF